MLPLCALAQGGSIKLLKQKYFKKSVPAGNYSGITNIGGNRYAVVSDKHYYDGFHVFEIDIDPVKGKIKDIRHLGFRSSGLTNRDEEGIAFRSSDSTIYISGESDNAVLQYTHDGQLTGRRLNMPARYGRCVRNRSLESLCYDESTNLFWTCNEWTLKGDSAGVISMQSFGDDLQPRDSINYRTHFGREVLSRGHTPGVSDLMAPGDGTIIVLERDVYTAKKNIGSYALCSLYRIRPLGDGRYEDLGAIATWKTKFNITRQNFANYEGLCMGPALADGRKTIILVADSQNQYKGLLRDWFKVIVME